MYDVLDVCRYIINYSNEKGYGISNLKLQKILYFVQAHYLAFTPEHEPCFADRIEAWDFGPVVPKAYYEYKQYGGNDIPTIKTYFKTDGSNIWDTYKVVYDENCIDCKDKKRINQIVDEFKDDSATDLVSLTHHQAPWRNAYIPFMNNDITNESIRRYFSE